MARPVSVTAHAAHGLAEHAPFNLPAGTEDVITLTAQWANITGLCLVGSGEQDPH
jgi:hypothetical protein